MLGVDNARINSARQLRFLAYPSSTSLDPDPIAIGDAEPFRGLRVNLHKRKTMGFPQILDLPVFRIKKVRNPRSRGQHQWIVLGDLRSGKRAFGRLLI